MNLKNLFQDFNPSKCLVFCCLLVFCLLFALRLDGTIQWSYWLVFVPIWLWKLAVICGFSVGSFIWWKHPHYRTEGDSYTQYKAMVMCTGLHLLLLMFEILACDNLELGTHSWLLVFIPLIFMAVISVGICVWAIKNKRSFEMELFCAVNILQFIFLALRFDKIILWSWVIVFIPLWIVMCVALIGVLYAVVLAIILLKSPDIIPEQRRGNVSSAVGYSFLVIPLLVFEILLANRLDATNDFDYIAIVVPLLLSLLTLVCLSFDAKRSNHWWFGIRKDFCQFLLGLCPCLQEYGNISYSQHHDDSDSSLGPLDTHKAHAPGKPKRDAIEDQPISVVPVLSIETPD